MKMLGDFKYKPLIFVKKNAIKMNRIKEVLEQKGIKQTWLAEKLGKSYPVINGYAQNKNQPRLEVLFEIANLLNVDVKDLIHSNFKNI